MNSVHILLVSERLLANGIPALMEKPEAAVLVASQPMIDQGLAERLAALLGNQGIATEVHGGLPDGDLAAISDYALELVADLEQRFPREALSLNLTGGNKLMTLGFREALGGEVGRMFYTDTANGVLEEVPAGSGRSHQQRPIEGVLDLPTYLAAQGMTFRSAVTDDPKRVNRMEQRKAATKHLAHRAVELGNFLGALGGLASQALNAQGSALVAPQQAFSRPPAGPGPRP